MTYLNHFLSWAPAILAPLAAYLYFALKVELKLIARRGVSRAELESRLNEVITELETLRTRLAAVETRPAVQDSMPQDWAPQALNLNRRGQILRLHGKGRSIAEIASDLQISQGEVELLVKVHDLSTPSLL